MLCFTMEDTGIGMDAAFLPRLFDAFSQEDNDNTTRYGGSGLGMAITKNIVGMMGGEISVESEKGRGTAFRVTVPLRRVRETERPADALQPAPAEAISLKGRHLLIAEDQEINAEVLTDLRSRRKSPANGPKTDAARWTCSRKARRGILTRS